MNNFLGILLAILFFPFGAIGQTTVQPKQYDYSNLGILYTKEQSFGLDIQTNGVGFVANFGKIQSYYLTKYYHFNLGFIKHPKESRQNLRYQSSTNIINSFVYSKKNSFFVLRGGMGMKRMLTEKIKRKGVTIGLVYEGGASIGILKPYYLRLDRSIDGFRHTSLEKYSSENHDLFLDITRISGSGGMFRGLGESKIIPGITRKICRAFWPGRIRPVYQRN